eukprot:PhF_6_TR41074/c1_g1_i1/m.62217
MATSPRSAGQVIVRDQPSATQLAKRTNDTSAGNAMAVYSSPTRARNVTQAEQLGLASGLRAPFDRPTAFTDASVAFMRRFVTSAAVPPKSKKDFIGTVVNKRFKAAKQTDVKCAEYVSCVDTMWIANKDGSITVFDGKTCAELLSSPQRDIHCGAMREVFGNVWGGFSDGFVRVLNATDMSVIINLARHTGEVTSIAHSPGGKYVFSSSLDFTILQWDARTYANSAKFIH